MSITQQLKNVNHFLNTIFEGRPAIINYGIDQIDGLKSCWLSNGQLTEDGYNFLMSHNQNGCGIFFTVQSSSNLSRKGINISYINALNMDYDIGHNSQYQSVDDLKSDIKRHWLNSGFSPNIIIDTKNGCHLYWLVQNFPKEKFKIMQKALMLKSYQCFGLKSDQTIFKLSGILRLPTFYHQKDKDNPYEIKYSAPIHTKKYYLQNVIDFVEEKNIVIAKNEIKNEKTKKRGYHCDLGLSPFIPVTIKKRVKGESEREISVPLSFDNLNISFDNSICSYWDRIINKYVITYDNFMNHINKLNPYEIFGLNKGSFRCLFHNDSKPSATFYQGKDNGNWLYYCHADGCSASHKPMTNMQTMAKLLKITQNEMLDKIMDKFNLVIDYNNGAYEIEKATMWNLNVGSMLAGTEYEHCISEMQTISNVFINQLQYNLPKHNNKAPFYMSNEYFGQAIGKSKAAANRFFSFAYWLGLINRTSAENLQGDIFDRAIKEKGNRRYFISFFTIPEFNINIINQIKAQIRKATEQCLNISDMCANKIIELFGIDEAKRCFNINIEQLTEAIKKVIFDPVISMPCNNQEVALFEEMFQEIYISMVARGPTG